MPRKSASPASLWNQRHLMLSAADRPSLWSLIAVNSISVILAVIFGWSLAGIITLYWIENLVIGVFTILRMAFASGKTGDARGASDLLTHGLKFCLIPFFCVHYFGFCFGHGVFLSAMSGMISQSQGVGQLTISDGEGPVGMFLMLFTEEWSLNRLGLWLTILLFAVSHGVSFIRYFLGRGEAAHTSPDTEMFRPYGRIILLHVCIVLGGAVVFTLGSPWPLIVMFMAGKTMLDAGLHVFSHFQPNQSR
jgi:Family of unknown function (DUF6498)